MSSQDTLVSSPSGFLMMIGLPGTGKTHVRPGPPPGGSGPLRPLRSGLPFGAGTPRRQRDLAAPPAAQLDNFDFLLLDDLGYLPQGAEESEVLFTLIAERYERPTSFG